MPGTCAGLSGRWPWSLQDRVDEEQDDEVEDQHRDGVADDAHLARLVDAAETVGEALDRAQHRVEERALALVHVRHVGAERLRDERRAARRRRRSAGSPGHGATSPPSELLRPDERVEEVDEQRERDDAVDQVAPVHGSPRGAARCARRRRPARRTPR